MKIAGIEFPEPLLAALRDDRLVIFAGAGVSMGPPANLPDFKRLAELIAAGTGEVIRNGEPEDHFLGRLRFDGVDVHSRAAEILSRGEPSPTSLHRDLLRLYPDIDQVRVVTTNFDLLFEKAAQEAQSSPDRFVAPALPLGDKFRGIVHVHGAVSRPEQIVLTDADFGRAYLTEGWARRFLVNLFRHFTVLFVGYRHSDIIVNYLARSLPESEADKRFVLTSALDDRQKWRVLGIEPIVYVKSTDGAHSTLYEGLRRFADTVRRGTIDWQHEITELAANPPPIGAEEEDIINYALTDPVTTRFFVSAARSPEWIQWLDERKHFEPLFRDGDFHECHGMLAFWLAEHYAIRNAEELFLLIAKHGTRLSRLFWWELGRDIFARYQPPIDQKLLTRWVSLLIATAPVAPDHHILLWMGERCAKEGALSSLLLVFDFMATSRLALRKSFSRFTDQEDDSHDKIEVALSPISDEYTLNHVWASGLKPNLPEVASPLLKIAVSCLSERYLTWVAWQRANREFDLDSWGRSAIEPHEQDSRREVVDVLVDAARDCLEYLVSNSVNIAQTISWCDQLSASDVPLLRRLAIHISSLRKDSSADDKLDWLTHFGLHDGPARHELFRAAQLIYSQASPDARAKAIEAVLAYRWPNETDQDKERRSARRHYDWLHWLYMAAPDCALTKEALDNVLAAYPEFKPNDNPDMTHWMTGGWIGPRSPWTAEELLGKRPAEWLHELLSFQSTDVLGADRNGLISAIAEAAKRDATWGLDLGDSLAAANNWDADLWEGLFGAWRATKLEESQDRRILLFLDRTELHPTRFREIADVLCEWVKRDDKSLSLDMLSEANAVASSLWQEVDGTELPTESDDWLFLAINSAPGVLAQFWLHSLSRWRKGQDPTPSTLNDEYRLAMSTIVSDRTSAGRLGRCVLCSHLAFLLVADEDWTQERLLPVFNLADNIAEFQAAWDGFLAWGNLNPTVAKLLEPAFLRAVRHIGTTRDRRERFTEYFVSMLIYFVTDPLATWIPEFFDFGTVEMRHHFAWVIERQLQGMDEKRQMDLWHRWLRRYWENRLQGVPKPFDDREIEGTLNWLPYMKDVFPEAVELAVRMRPVELQDGSMIYQLAKTEIPAVYNESLARLLLSLGRHRAHHVIWTDGRALIDRLLEAELSPSLSQGLKELMTKLGL